MKRLSLLLALAVFCLPASAQEARVLTDSEWCDDGWGGSDRNIEAYCEVREITLPAGRQIIAVDAGKNGGVAVEGWDRNEIRIRAKVVGYGRTEGAAREMAAGVEIDTEDRIHANLPEGGRKEWAYVSYHVHVPRRSNLDLEAHNGGIRIEGVAGDIAFDTRNGGVTLVDLAGDVRGRTTNGGLEVELTGRQWEGDGMDVETTNGGVEIVVPEEYSAHLETRTVNGKVYFDFPVTVQGRIDREFSTDLGQGGKTIRIVTTNGGVDVRKS